METKKWWQSRVIWFNIISGIVGTAGVLSHNSLAADPKVQGIFASIVSIGNIALRFVTDTPIEGAPSK